MPFKTFVAGTEGLASDVNTYLMNQAIATFSSTGARNSAITAPVEGQVAYISNTDIYTYYDGAAWQNLVWANWIAYTPTFTNLTQGTGSTTSAYYTVVGKTVMVQVYVTMGTTPTVGGQFSISLPIDIASSNRSGTIGTCLMRDAGGALSYLGSVFATGSAPSVARMQTIGTAGATATLSSQTATNPFTWNANAGNYFSFTIIYQGV